MIHANEPKAIGGTDEDPAPMYYFTAGLALCFMAHIMGFIKVKQIEVNSVALELRGNFNTELGHIDRGGQGKGGAQDFVTNVIVESSEPVDNIKELVAACEEACVAHQSMVNPVLGKTAVFLNGSQI